MTRIPDQEEMLAVDAPPATTRGVSRSRLDSLDLLRGLVIVIMALDHVKGNFSNAAFDATDLTRTTPVYFLTRWITHFCAPTFVFLAGTGAFLYGARTPTKTALSWFLFSRGLWLIFLEFTVIRFSWFGNFNYVFTVGQVIWAIGCSMMVLSGLVYLPVSFITAFGVSMIAFHNLTDRIGSDDWGDLGWLWRILHTGQPIEFLPGRTFAPSYPLIPWVGVMAAGYGFGALMLLEPRRRRREVLGLGLALILIFLALRFSNLYGDKAGQQVGRAGPWELQRDWLFTVFSFVNCQKYPPSLDFLLMTLGPALCAVVLFDRAPGKVGRIFIIFGRVPLFFYLLHFYLIKALSIGFAYLRYGRADWLFGDARPDRIPADAGYDLWAVYLVWLLMVLLLYPVCYWFAGVKQRSRAAWLSYL